MHGWASRSQAQPSAERLHLIERLADVAIASYGLVFLFLALMLYRSRRCPLLGKADSTRTSSFCLSLT